MVMMPEEATGTSLRPQLARKRVCKAIKWAPICSVNSAAGVAITVWLSPAVCHSKIKEPAQRAVHAGEIKLSVGGEQSKC